MVSKKSCRNASATATLRFNALLRTTALSLLLFLPLHADEIFGRVVRVADGDTITILVSGDTRFVASETVGSRVPRDRTSERIRLHGIDAPERGQPFGRAAGRYLSGLVANRDVRVEYTNRDRYGRIVGIVFLDGCDINLEMLKAGLAWHYKHYDPTPAYAQSEAAARAARRGLRVDSNPILPEQFRHPGRARSPSAPLASTTVGSAPRADRAEYRAESKLPIRVRTPTPVCDQWPDTGYWLSTNSNKRHNRNCENYRNTRGYPCGKYDGTPCGKCGG